jgi:hypothetical protein
VLEEGGGSGPDTRGVGPRGVAFAGGPPVSLAKALAAAATCAADALGGALTGGVAKTAFALAFAPAGLGNAGSESGSLEPEDMKRPTNLLGAKDLSQNMTQPRAIDASSGTIPTTAKSSLSTEDFNALVRRPLRRCCLAHGGDYKPGAACDADGWAV